MPAWGLVTPQISSGFLEPQSNVWSKNKVLNPEHRKAGLQSGGGRKKGLGREWGGNGALSLTSLNSVHWISAVIIVERGRGYENILSPCKPTCAGRKGKKPKRTVTVVCPILLAQSQESSVYSRGPGPGPEMESGDAAD